ALRRAPPSPTESQAGCLLATQARRLRYDPLLEAQCDDGVDFEGASRWEIASGEGGGSEQHRHAAENQWIARIHPVKKGTGQSGRTKSRNKTDGQSNCRQQHALTQDQPKHLAALRA